MAAMKLAGAEVDYQFSESFEQIIHDESLDQKMNARMMEQMQISWDDIEVNDQNLGFKDFSLEPFRQDLLEEFKKDKLKYENMSKGVYTGFKSKSNICTNNGLIALLGYPSKPPKKMDHVYQGYDLIYIDMDGKAAVMNQREVLEILEIHKKNERYVSDSINKGKFTC